MKQRSNISKDTPSAEWGFEKPPEGWSNYKISEPIEVVEKEDRKTLRIPFVCVSEDGDGTQLSVFCSLTGKGTKLAEQRLADIVTAVGLASKMEKKFPGDVSYLSQEVINNLKIDLPDKVLALRIEYTKAKDGKEYANAQAIGIRNYTDKKKPADTQKTDTPSEDEEELDF